MTGHDAISQEDQAIFDTLPDEVQVEAMECDLCGLRHPVTWHKLEQPWRAILHNQQQPVVLTHWAECPNVEDEERAMFCTILPGAKG